jgi:hypothetical protein
VLKLLNPWAILAVVLAIVGAGGYGMKLGRDLEIAKQAKEVALEERIQKTLAEEVSKIKIVNRPKIEKLETITREVPVYTDCQHTDAAFGLLNDIAEGKTSIGNGDRVVPEADGAHGQELRNNN